MKKLTSTFIALSILFTPALALGASVTVNAIPNSCGSIVIRGTASYTAPESLHLKLNGQEVGSFTSGDSTYQLVVTSGINPSNTVTVEVQDAVFTVIASDTTSFTKATCGNQNPDFVGQAWGLTGFNTPKVSFGTSVYDGLYFTDKCEYKNGCFDISKTSYYRLPVLKLLGR